MTARAVFFDAVGTLLHPEPAATVVYAEAARRFGSGCPTHLIARRFARAFQTQETLDRASGWVTSGARELERSRAIVGMVLDDAADPAGCFDFLYRHFARPEAWRSEPGAEALFEALLARGCQLGLASNLDERLYALVAGIKPLRYLADNMVVSFEVGYRKPARQYFKALCRRTNLDSAAILHVGDDLANDYAGAEAAGMPALLFDPRGKHAGWGGRRIDTLGEVMNFL